MLKMVLTPSLGNAAAESRLSIKKELLINSMTEETIVSQRVVFDTILAAGVVVSKVEITSNV